MVKVEDKIKFLKTNLKEVISYLDTLEEKNFDESFIQIQNSLKTFEIVRKELIESDSTKELKKFNKEFEVLIKEIQKRFDSMLRENKSQQKIVVKELNEVVNKKKLANYR
ncbi:MAG: hypothetical protein JEY94_18605 [Melioribacteraceae bacterium]|nr:hypothetical protein [Melioribacteraceae bacterium]